MVNGFNNNIITCYYAILIKNSKLFTQCNIYCLIMTLVNIVKHKIQCCPVYNMFDKIQRRKPDNIYYLFNLLN